MKFSRLFIQFLCITFCFTCSEKEITPRPYPRIQTLSVDNITTEGARFTAEITFASQAIEEHGFLWSVSSGPLLDYNSDIINLGAASGTGKFSARAERSLAAGKVYYMRAYLKAGGKVVLGNVLEFKSLGSKAPRITSFEPLSGFVKDTVHIRGENFSNRPENVKVMFGDKTGELIQVSDTLLVTRVPAALATELCVVSVTIAGNSGESPEKFRLIPPQTKAVSASEVAPGDTLTISGSNFNLNPQFLQVFLNNEACILVGNTADEIKVVVPFFRPTSDQVSLKVVSSNLAATHSQPLTYLKPVITALEARTNISIGDTLRLKGKNIFTSTLVLKFAGNVITPVKTSRDYIDFAIAKDITSYVNNVQVTFGQNIVDFQTNVVLSRPVITAITPSTATFNEEIVITGKNFHPRASSNLVLIAGESATVTAATTESLTIKVPAKIGDCTAQNTCNQLYLSVLTQAGLPNTLFSLRAPVIESISPTEATNGQLTVSGKYFNPDNIAFNTAVIDGKSVRPISATGTTLIFNATAFNPTPLLSLKKETTITVANSNAYPISLNLKGPYTQKAKTPAALLQRTRMIKAVAGNSAYVGLGHHNTNGTVYSDFYEYNASNDQWTRLADFPGTMRKYAVAFALGDYVYLGMGLNPATDGRLADMWRYSITTGTWQQIQDFPGTPRYDAFAFVTGNMAYVGGGYTAPLTPTLEFWSFDGSVWQQKNNMPAYNSGQSTFFVQNDLRVYTFFGSKLHAYVVPLDTWSGFANVPSTLQTSAFTGGMLSGNGYLWTSSPSASSMLRYTRVTNQWQDLQTPFGIYNPDSFVINNKLYIFMGSQPVSTNVALTNDYVWEFDAALYPQ